MVFNLSTRKHSKRVSRAQNKASTKAQRVKAKEVTKHFRAWSEDRPHKPMTDSLFEELMKEAKGRSSRIKGMSNWERANTTGLSTSTVRHHLNGITKQPKGISLQMWARALGGHIVFIKDN
jgi:hypothetical protein